MLVAQSETPALPATACAEGDGPERLAVKQGVTKMLYWAAVFFVIALLAAFLGFGGLAAGAAGIAKILFFVFLVLAVISLIAGRRVTS
jgi:uncharacterized membrane protein YtjA (UPF0391 family)